MLKAFALQTKKRSLGLKMSFILKKKKSIKIIIVLIFIYFAQE